MRRPSGPSHKLSRAHIRRVLRWHAEGIRFHREFGTAQVFARRKRLSLSVVRRAMRSQTVPGSVQRTRGAHRASALTRAQHLAFKRWLRAYRAYVRARLSARELARELGVSRFTIFDCIRRRGRYAHAKSDAVRRERTVRGASSRSASGCEREIATRAHLLASWPIAELDVKPTRSHRAKRSARRSAAGAVR